MKTSGPVQVINTGLIPYAEAWALQTRLHEELITRKRSGYPDAPHHYFLLCEHPPVYTLGKSGDMDHLHLSEQGLEAHSIEFFKINRGGDITYHGPGQLVGYPILDLDLLFTDVHRYVRSLEEVIIRTLATYGIEAGRDPQHTGVWVSDPVGRSAKVCAIGVHLSRWVTMHGFALNVNTDLRYFNHITPCGIADSDRSVTSISALTGTSLDLGEVAGIVQSKFSEVFAVDLQPAQIPASAVS